MMQRRPLFVPWLAPAVVALDDGWLRWAVGPGRALGPRQVAITRPSAGRRMLRAFLRLGDGVAVADLVAVRGRRRKRAAEAIERRGERVKLFASEFGVLTLDDGADPNGSEPLAWWVGASKLFASLFAVALALQGEEDEESTRHLDEHLEAISRLLEHPWAVPPKLKSLSRSPARFLPEPAALLEAVARACGVGVAPVRERSGRIVLALGGRSLLAGLAAQLLLAAAGVDRQRGAAVCAACGAVFVPEQRGGGPRRYCGRCGRRAALRDAARDYRRRRREAKRLAQRGLTPAEIAERVGARSAATVRRWLRAR